MAEKNFIKKNNFIWCFPKTFYPQGIRNKQENLLFFFKKFSTVFIRVFNNGQGGFLNQGFKGFKRIILIYNT